MQIALNIYFQSSQWQSEELFKIQGFPLGKFW